MQHRQQKTFAAKSIAIYFSLNVEIRDEGRGTGLLTIPLLSLTGLLMLVWGIRGSVTRMPQTLRHWFLTIRMQLTVLLTVSEIGFRSTLYGFGVPV